MNFFYSLHIIHMVTLTWCSVLITIVLIYPIPYHSWIKHSRIYPASWLSLWSVRDDSTTWIPVAHCRSGQQSKRSGHPRHALLESVVAVLPFAEFFYKLDVGLRVVGFQKPASCLKIKWRYMRGVYDVLFYKKASDYKIILSYVRTIQQQTTTSKREHLLKKAGKQNEEQNDKQKIQFLWVQPPPLFQTQPLFIPFESGPRAYFSNSG